MNWAIRFALRQPGPIEVCTEFEGSRISTNLGSRELVVEDLCAHTLDEALKLAWPRANRFLNAVARKYGAALDIDPTRTISLSEDEQGSSINLSVADTAVISEGIIAAKRSEGTGETEVYDSRRPGRIEIEAVDTSEAGSYYRQGKLAQDPFEAFRNFYLVAENIADRIRIARSNRRMGEEILLTHALEECFQSNSDSLKARSKAVPGLHLKRDVYSEVASLLYKGFRCQLSHSKACQDKKVPFNPEDERTVAEVLPLMTFVASALLDYARTLPIQ